MNCEVNVSDSMRDLLQRWLKLLREPSSEDVHALERETAELIGETRRVSTNQMGHTVCEASPELLHG